MCCLGRDIGFLRYLEKEFVESGLDPFSITFYNLKCFSNGKGRGGLQKSNVGDLFWVK